MVKQPNAIVVTLLVCHLCLLFSGRYEARATVPTDGTCREDRRICLRYRHLAFPFLTFDSFDAGCSTKLKVRTASHAA